MSTPFIEKVGNVLMPSGNKALYGAVGGTVLAIVAMLPGGETSVTVTPGQGELTHVKLAPGEYCGPETETNVKDIKATWHFHEGWSWMPDIANRSQTLDGVIDGKLCLKTKSIFSATYNKATGKYDMHLVGDPDPAKSDIELITWPVKADYNPSGNLSTALLNAQLGVGEAIAQAIGVDHVPDPIAALDSNLKHFDDIEAANVASASCTALAEHELTDPESDKVERMPGQAAPRDLQQEIVSDMFQQNPLLTKAHVTYKDFDISFTISPQGVPNEYTAGVMADRAEAAKKHISFPTPGDIPPCIDKTQAVSTTGETQ